MHHCSKADENQIKEAFINGGRVMAFHEGLLESCKKKWCGSYEGV